MFAKVDHNDPDCVIDVTKPEVAPRVADIAMGMPHVRLVRSINPNICQGSLSMNVA